MSDSSEALYTTTGSLAAVRPKSVNTKIFRALLSIASAALLIRVMGMLNQIVVTGHFGEGPAMDAYFVATSIPILAAQLAVGAIEASVIPVYASIRRRSKETKEQASRLLSTCLNLLLITGVVVTVVMYVFRRQMIFISAPALDAMRLGYAVYLTPFILPALLLTLVIGFLECILNTEGQFGWPAYAGLLVPLVTAAFVLLLGKSLGVVALAIGMITGLCLQLCIFLIGVRRTGITYRPVLDLRDPVLASILVAAWPVFLGAFINQASPLVDQIFASFLSAGSISAITYALKLISVPVGVIFVSVGRAALPYLARQVARNNMNAFKETLRFYLWTVGITTAVLTIFMIVLAHPIVQILFQRGAFTAEDTKNTANTMVGFAIGLIPMALGFIGARAFSALGKTRVLMYVTTFSVIANAVFDYIFARLWQSVGIAVSTSLVYFCTMFILFFTLRRMIGKLNLFRPPRELLGFMWKIGIGRYYIRWLTWKEEVARSLDVSYYLHMWGQWLTRIGIILVVFATGVVAIFLNFLYALRVSFGSLVILAFLRYRFALLLAWVLINALIGSPLPIFNGNNLSSGLILPLLLLMVCMPIPQTLKRMPALSFMLLYVLWVFASIGISAIGVGAFLTQWIFYLSYIAIGVLTINVLTTERRLRELIDAILLLSLFVALYGMYGYLTKQNGVLDSSVGFRIYSVFGSAPTLALFLSLVIPLALYRILTVKGFQRIVSIIVFATLLAALGLSFTRTAFISVPVSIIITAFFLPSRKMKMSVFGSLLALAALLFLLTRVADIPLFNRFFQQDVTTLNGRTLLWQAIISHLDLTQLLGNGLNASDVLLTNLRVSDIHGVIAFAPHNLFLGTLYDHGVIGVILLGLVAVSLFVGIIAGIRKTTGTQHLLFLTTLAVFVNVVIQSIDNSDFLISGIAIYFWVIMALPFALCWSAHKKQAVISEEALLDDVDDEATLPRMQAITQNTTMRGDSSRVTQNTAMRGDSSRITYNTTMRGDSSKRRSISQVRGSMIVEDRIRACFVSLLFFPSIGGSQARTEKQARQLQALGHKVTILTSRLNKHWKRAETLDGLSIVRVGGLYKRGGELRIGKLGIWPVTISMFLQLWRLRHSYDVIHVFQVSPLAAAAALVGKLTHKPVIISIMNSGPDEMQLRKLEQGAKLMTDTLADTPLLNVDEKDWLPTVGDFAYLPQSILGGRAILNFLRKSDAFYQILSTRSRAYLTSYGFRSEQIVHIPGSVDVEKFRPVPGRWQNGGAYSAAASPERSIICVARLDFSKGVDVLLHAWGRMMHAPDQWRRHLKPRLRIVGDGPFKPQMEYIVAQLGISDSVEFLGLRTDIKNLLQESWGFVMPSRWEGMPNALLEAMACGLPCIATWVSGSEDIIGDEINGLLVEPERPDQMAYALQRLIEDVGLAQRLGQEARATVVHHYQLTRVVEQCLQLYRRLLSKDANNTKKDEISQKDSLLV